MAGIKHGIVENVPQWAKNIRTLRKYKGMTQTQLGDALHISSSQISRYEKYERGDTPDDQTFSDIADYFCISVWALKNEDISYEYLDKQEQFIKADELQNVGQYVYILTTSKAAKRNEHFKNAEDYWDRISRTLSPMPNMIQRCKEEFFASFKQDKILAGAANTLLVIVHEFCFLGNKDGPFTKLNDGLMRRKEFDTVSRALVKERAKLKEEFWAKNEEMFYECIKALREHINSIAYADYYLALKYVLDMADSGLETEDNFTTGMLMMSELAQLDNKYALQYLEMFEKLCDE